MAESDVIYKVEKQNNDHVENTMEVKSSKPKKKKSKSKENGKKSKTKENSKKKRKNKKNKIKKNKGKERLVEEIEKNPDDEEEEEEEEEDWPDIGSSEDDYSFDADYGSEEVYDDSFLADYTEDEVLPKDSFSSITKEEAAKIQMKLIEQVEGELNLKKWDASRILQHFDWNITKLHAQYWENPKKIKKASGLVKRRRKKKYQKGDTVECLICYDDVKASEAYSLRCSHGPYCKNCWNAQLKETVNNSSAEAILNVKCMWPKCEAKMTYRDFKKLGDDKDFKRFEYFFLKYFVEEAKNLSFCPNPSCGRVLKYSGEGSPMLPAQCICGYISCFKCNNEHHNPVTCDQLLNWSQKNMDDQESVKLVMATSKPCYHCKMPTTRIDGCNHMTCRKDQGGCGGEWCWMCRGDWKAHGEHTGGFYSCNKYDSSTAKKEDDEAAKMKEESDRYLHYFNRYFNNDQSKKTFDKMMHNAQDKARDYQEQTNGNADFFEEAVHLLAKCRHTLKYTYVYGYYLPDGSKGKEFFEYLQANAEGITERLADQVNQSLSSLDIPDFKNRIRVTKKYIENLVEGIEAGLVDGIGKEK